MSDEGSAQPVAAPSAGANSATDNGAVDTKIPDAPALAAAEPKADGPNPTEEKADKGAAEPAKEDETSKQAEGKKKKKKFSIVHACNGNTPRERDHPLTTASTFLRAKQNPS